MRAFSLDSLPLPFPRFSSTLYAAVARRRRERYAARPELRHRLRRPVISVGNLAVGGRGKTPLVASLARLLHAAGERPAILSRGYGRALRDRDVVIVRDAAGIRADLARSGDEPLMLARQLPGISVVVGADRYRAGCVAEEQLGASVHILDDGFQHLQLDRDLDLLILNRQDIEQPLTLPRGRLREPLDTIIVADALLTFDPEIVVEASGVDLPIFRLKRSAAFYTADSRPALAVAGIALPGRFFSDLEANGWTIAGRMAFADHHRYSRRDLDRIVREAARLRAARIVTTEKDFVRLLPLRPFPLPIEHVGIAVDPDPIEPFRDWLLAGLRTTRGEASG